MGRSAKSRASAPSFHKASSGVSSADPPGREKRLRTGAVPAAPVESKKSVTELFKGAGELPEYLRGVGGDLVPGICIGTHGAVRTVKVFSKVPLPEAQTIAVDRGSRSSVAMLRVLLAEMYDRKPDLQHGGFDATAYFEPTQTHSDQLVLVAAPSVAARLARMDDLDAVPRLIDRAWEGHWHQWVGPEHAVTAGPVIEFTLFAMATSAVCAGHGVLVGRLSLLGALLATGELVEPFDRRVATGDHIAFRRRDDRRLEPLDDWLATCFDHAGEPPRDRRT